LINQNLCSKIKLKLKRFAASKWRGFIYGSGGSLAMISKKVFIMNGIESEILKNISVAVYICDPEMNVTYVNSYCETLTGVSAKDAVNKKCYELFGSSHCSQMQECPFKKAVQTGQFVSTSKIYYKTGKGLVKRVQRSASPVKKDGKLEYVIVYLNEIEEKPMFSKPLIFDEYTYYLMFKNAPGMAHSIDVDNLICDVNDKWLSEMGYSREEVIGTPVERYMSPESARFAREVILPQLWKTGNISNVQYRLITRDKKNLDVLINCAVLQTKLGQVSFSIMQNITEQLKLTRELRETAAKLEQINIIKSHFITNLGYEIRTPMTNIVGFTDMLSQTKISDEQQKLVGHIKKSGEMLFSTITSLLEYSKIESDEVVLETGEFSFKKLILETVNAVMDRAETQSDKLYYSIDSNLRHNVFGDESKIKLIIMNLLDNAVKFCENSEIKIKLSVVSETSENVLIKVEVSDQGIGIAAENLENIFLPFYQIDEGITRKHHGLGLGLTISNHYVKMMGGERIFVESTPGAGSKFYFNLYLAKAAQNKKISEPAAEIPGKQNYYIGKKILVVEDNHLNIEVICRLLKICQCEFTVVENGLSAIDIIKSGEKFDAILMDIKLPEISGIETSKKIREYGCQTPIIAVTAYSSSNDKLLCFGAGMNDYLTKPINFNLLVNSIKTHCAVPAVR